MSRKLFVGGLDFEKTTSESLYNHFSEYGEIVEAIVILDKFSGRSKGYGFVTFVSEESARDALVEPNPVIDGRKANVNVAYTSIKKPLPISTGHGPVPHSPKHQQSHNHYQQQQQQQRHNMNSIQQSYSAGGPPHSPSAFGFQFGYPYGQYPPGPALFYPIGATPSYAGAAAPIQNKDTNMEYAHMMAPPPSLPSQQRRQNFHNPIMYFLQPSPGYQQPYFVPMSPTMIMEEFREDEDTSMTPAPPVVLQIHSTQQLAPASATTTTES